MKKLLEFQKELSKILSVLTEEAFSITKVIIADFSVIQNQAFSDSSEDKKILLK